ncbi:unnamed protein product [Phaeothamnion confervicola]
MVTFPGHQEGPWGAEGSWHIDGAHFQHFPESREQGLLPIFLFSDIAPGHGGTALLPGSHLEAARALWRDAGADGLTAGELTARLLPVQRPEEVREATGKAGDVMLCHPMLLHSRSRNLAPVAASGVRIISNPCVRLRREINFGGGRALSPVAWTVWLARQQLLAEGWLPAVGEQDGGGGAEMAPTAQPVPPSSTPETAESAERSGDADVEAVMGFGSFAGGGRCD